MKSKGSIAIVLMALCLSPSSALPDLLAPFRNMLGMRGSASNHNPYTRPAPLSSPRDPSASHVHKQFSSSMGEDPFKSDFGFGRPPVANSGGEGPPSGFGPPGHHEHGPPSHPHSRPSHGPPSSSYHRGGPNPHSRPGPQHHSSFPYASPPGGHRGFSHSGRPGGRPSGPPGSRSRPVRQQPGYAPHRPGGFSPSSAGPPYGRPQQFSSPVNHPQPNGPPEKFRGPGQDLVEGPYKYRPNEASDDSPSGPSSASPYSQGPGGFGPPPQSASSLDGRPGEPGPNYPPPSFTDGSSHYSGRTRPRGRPPPHRFSNQLGEGPEQEDNNNNGPQGPGFSGFGQFPGEEAEEESPRGPPPGSGFGPPQQQQFGPPSGPRQYNRPASHGGRPQFGNSSPPSRFPPSSPSGPSQDDESGPPDAFFAPSPGNGGGPSGQGSPEYQPEPYDDQPSRAPQGPTGPQGPGPEVIGDDVGKYPPQISDDDEGNQQGGNFGFGNNSPFGGQGGSSSSNNGEGSAPWERAPFGAEDGPGPNPSSASPPPFKPQRRQRPRRPSPQSSPPSSSGSSSSLSAPNFSFGNPNPGSYQEAESNQYGKSMMMSASTPKATNVAPSVLPPPSGPMPGRKPFSAKFMAPRGSGPRPKILRLSSPRDPNYRPMMASSLHPVSAPYSEPYAAASGGGGWGGGGGDRILYHVSGHQGKNSYKFGYDTGKGKNRLFRYEEKDGKGYVKGKYGFYDKGGKLQVINYEAHPKHGFHAERTHGQNF